jgi:hypothetical protein
MTEYYQKGIVYVALTEKTEIGLILNEQIDISCSINHQYFINQHFKTITAEAFNAAYRQTMATIKSEFGRLMMIQTDQALPKATDQEKREEHQRYPADDEQPHTGEHMEFDC